MRNFVLNVFFLIVISLSYLTNAQTQEKNFLSRQGNKIVDAGGNEVQLTGVNWFGFETQMGFFHGIWSRDHKSVLQQIKDIGFNCIRIPWNNKILEQDISGKINSYGTDPYTGVSPMNEEESTLSAPIEILDITIRWCQENNLKVILDNHSREPDGYMVEGLWYTENISHEKWIEDWIFIADRYKEYDAVIAMDINNEPHGAYGAGSRWGTGDTVNDWRLAAQECGNAILEVNPNVLIFVEGTEEFEETSYWWGGNLQGVREYPVVLSNPNKLVYSPHEYGPTVYNQDWFSSPDFPENMEQIWEDNFNYLYTNGTSPIFVGEFGIRDPDGVDEVWFDRFLKFMDNHKHHWTYWCLNPNSGDTGGLLDNSWSNVVEWKMEKLTSYLAPEITNGTIIANENVPGVFEQIATVDSNVNIGIKISWESSEHASYYSVIVADNKELIDPIADETKIWHTSFQLSGLDYDTRYYWSVTAINKNGSTEASNAGISFITQSASDTTIGSNCDNGETLDSCGNCVGGNTESLPCTKDCNGDWGGTAFIDDCDICSDGNTGLTACNNLTALSKTDKMKTDIKIYPNPLIEGDLHIELPEGANALVQIYTLTGHKVHIEQQVNERLIIDKALLEKGIYIIRVDQENAHNNYKLLLVE